MENLECKIESLRQELYIIALDKGLTHPDVLIISQMLDEVINEFCKLALV